jgi:plastocyanin
MNKRSTAVLKVNVFLSLAAVLLASCGGGGESPPPPPASTVLTTACTGTEIVNAVGITSWDPGTVTIKVNDVVQWNNSTSSAHTVTSTTVPANGTFNVPLNIGTSVCLKFTAAGAFNYHCSIHPEMIGLITVVN